MTNKQKLKHLKAKLDAGKPLTPAQKAWLAKQKRKLADTRTGHRTFDTMKAAAAAMGIPIGTLKLAKQYGCPAFKGSRVFEQKLIDWMAANGDKLGSGDADYKALKLQEEFRRLKLSNDRADGLLIEVEKVKADWKAVLSKVMVILRRKLENEYPARVAGLEAPAARVYGKRVVDEINKELRSLAYE